MRFSIVALVTPLLLAASALAEEFGNCKCQDKTGQYNDYTERCCKMQFNAFSHYHGDQVHQCSNPIDKIDDDGFEACCVDRGAHGAFCW
ncbi:hypothetical protein Q9L58_008866 [Maublancomyces gigas]|uniref:Plethodontid modulating factor n=1 Tax=Discina gigas TaxID=1032678 RepID=A0ABR3G8I8_9PEZI